MKYDRQQLIQEVLDTLSALRGLFHHGHDPLFQRHGFGLPQFKMMLSMAAAADGVSVSELSKHMGITPPAITQFVDKLVRKGLVERFEDGKDRRVVRIRLTKDAQKKFGAIKSYYYGRMADVFKNLDDKELEQLSSILKKLQIDPPDFSGHDHKKWRAIKKDIK